MKRGAVIAAAAVLTTLLAVPAVAVTVTMLATQPAKPFGPTVAPKVNIKTLGYHCDQAYLSGSQDDTYIVTSGGPPFCLVNPTGYFLENANTNASMGTVLFDNVLRRDPNTGLDVVVIGAVAFGSDDGKTACCNAAGVTLAPGPDPVINTTCKPCEVPTSNSMTFPADVIWNVGKTAVNVGFFDSLVASTGACDVTELLPSYTYRAGFNCGEPTKRFTITSSPKTKGTQKLTCNVTVVSTIATARAVTVATGVTAAGSICADVAAAAQGRGNHVTVNQTCGSCKGAGF